MILTVMHKTNLSHKYLCPPLKASKLHSAVEKVYGEIRLAFVLMCTTCIKGWKWLPPRCRHKGGKHTADQWFHEKYRKKEHTRWLQPDLFFSPWSSLDVNSAITRSFRQSEAWCGSKKKKKKKTHIVWVVKGLREKGEIDLHTSRFGL